MEYEVDGSEYGKFVNCEVCGKGFVVGTSIVGRKVKEAESISGDDGIPRRRNVRTVAIALCIVVLYLVVCLSFAMFITSGVDGKKTKASEDGEYSFGGYSSSSSSSYDYSPSGARKAIEGALANVKERYWRNLSRVNLVESLYVDRDDYCQLILVEPIGDTPLYTIRYWKSSNTLEWTRLMSKEVAELFIQDRMLIDHYKKVLSADE